MIIKGQKNGVVLIMVFMIMIALVLIVGAYLYVVSTQMKSAGYDISNAKAFWIAEAGVQKTVYYFKTSSSYRNSPQSFTENFGGGTYTVLQPVSDSQGGYNVTSTGTSGGIKRKITCNIKGGSVFNYGGFGSSSVTMTNSAYTDSYNSSLGLYNVNGNIGSDGDVGGNADISMSNSAHINGDASTGPSGTFSDPTHKYVSGTVTNANNVSLPAVVIPSTLTGLVSGGAVNVSNSGTMTLNSGNYKFSTIGLSNSATLTINATTAPVNIYLTGNIYSINISNSASIIIPATNTYPVTFYTDGGTSISNGSVVNNSYNPANLILYNTSANAVSIANSGNFYGAIYAPLASVSLSNSSTIYGSVISNLLTMANSAAIHYDKALTNVSMSGGTSSYSVTKWQEVVPA